MDILGSPFEMLLLIQGCLLGQYYIFYDENWKLFPYKLQMNQQSIDYDKFNDIYFAQYCRNEFIDVTKCFKGIVLFDERKVSLSGIVNNQDCLIWVRSVCNKCSKRHRTQPLFWFCGPCYKTNWILVFRQPKRDNKELYKYLSLLHNFRI